MITASCQLAMHASHLCVAQIC